MRLVLERLLMLMLLLLVMLFFIKVIVQMTIGTAMASTQTIFAVTAIAAKAAVHLQLLLGMLGTYCETATQAGKTKKGNKEKLK